jgi:hypothetical protein
MIHELKLVAIQKKSKIFKVPINPAPWGGFNGVLPKEDEKNR